jgi:hypothetical protein
MRLLTNLQYFDLQHRHCPRSSQIVEKETVSLKTTLYFCFHDFSENDFGTAQFKIRFKEQQISVLKKRVQMNSVELLSFVGGLLGLFAGFSFISLVEFVYIFFLKFLCFGRLPRFNLKCCKNTVEPDGSSDRTGQEKAFKSYIMLYMKESSVHSFNFISSNIRIIEK